MKNTPEMHPGKGADAPAIDPGKGADTKARKTDQRTRAAKRFRILVSAFTDDMGGGPLSHAEDALIRNAAALTVRAEQVQATLLAGEVVDDDALVRLTNAAARVLNMLGVQHTKRKNRDDDGQDTLPEPRPDSGLDPIEIYLREKRERESKSVTVTDLEKERADG